MGGISLPSTTVIMSIGMLIVSFLVGLLFFYVTSPDTKEIKKQQIDETTSLLFNFIIFIWIGKIVVNFSRFIKDPLAILAYPSNSNAFYIASLLIIVNILYNSIRKKKEMTSVFKSFVPLFLAASFIYEFLQVIVLGNRGDLLYLALITILLVVFLLLQGKISSYRSSFIVCIAWIIGQLVLSVMYSYSIIFGYMIAPIFFMMAFIFIILFVIVRRRGQVLKNGWY